MAPKGSTARYIGRQGPGVIKPEYLSREQIIIKLKPFGALIEQYIKQVIQHKKSSSRYHLQHVLSLKVHYLTEDRLKAIKRALDYKIYESGAIENFLSNNAQKKNELST